MAFAKYFFINQNYLCLLMKQVALVIFQVLTDATGAAVVCKISEESREEKKSNVETQEEQTSNREEQGEEIGHEEV